MSSLLNEIPDFQMLKCCFWGFNFVVGFIISICAVNAVSIYIYIYYIVDVYTDKQFLLTLIVLFLSPLVSHLFKLKYLPLVTVQSIVYVQSSHDQRLRGHRVHLNNDYKDVESA